jgi:hypothetical protein
MKVILFGATSEQGGRMWARVKGKTENDAAEQNRAGLRDHDGKSRPRHDQGGAGGVWEAGAGE